MLRMARISLSLRESDEPEYKECESWLDRKEGTVGNLCLSWQRRTGSLRHCRPRNLRQISHGRGHFPFMMHLVSVNVVVRLGSAHLNEIQVDIQVFTRVCSRVTRHPSRAGSRTAETNCWRSKCYGLIAWVKEKREKRQVHVQTRGDSTERRLLWSQQGDTQRLVGRLHRENLLQTRLKHHQWMNTLEPEEKPQSRVALAVRLCVNSVQH